MNRDRIYTWFITHVFNPPCYTEGMNDTVPEVTLWMDIRDLQG